MKLTKDDIGIEQDWTHRNITNSNCETFYSIHITPIKPYIDYKQAKQLKQQILDNQKLRELIENFFNGDNVMVKKEYKKLLEESEKK